MRWTRRAAGAWLVLALSACGPVAEEEADAALSLDVSLDGASMPDAAPDGPPPLDARPDVADPLDAGAVDGVFDGQADGAGDVSPVPDGAPDGAPDAAPDMARAPDAAVVGPDVLAYCDCMLLGCHELYHQLWGEDEGVARARCFRVATDLPRAPEATDGDNLDCRNHWCDAAFDLDELALCDRAGGLDVCN